MHLNLTEFGPLCPGSYADLASILDKDRCFNGNSIREVRITRDDARGDLSGVVRSRSRI